MIFGNRDVELAVKLGGQADVGTVLPDAFVAQNAQRLEQFCAETLRGVFTPPSLRHERSEAG